MILAFKTTFSFLSDSIDEDYDKFLAPTAI